VLIVKTRSFAVPILFAALFSTPCFSHHMAFVTSKQNPVRSMTSAQLGSIFRAETKKWPDGNLIILVLHRASVGESITLQRLNKMSARQWQSWISEHKDSVRIVDSDRDVLNCVESVPGAVGLVEVRSLTGRVQVVRVDGKMPMEEGYVSHGPAR
jgi:ABC-type phosphate transport system substrate-binding protein